MFRKYFVGFYFIAGFCPLNVLSSSCQSPDPYLPNDIITAMTWNAVGRPCPHIVKAKLKNESSSEFLTKREPAEEHQAFMEKTSEKILIRKRRFYVSNRDPIVTCELRYFVPLFSISTELASFFGLEFASGVDYAYPILGNNARGDAGFQVSEIFDGISNLISKLGVDGRTCVLRAICDVAAITPIKPQGLIRDTMEIAISHMLKAARNSSEESNETSSESNISYMDAVAVGKSGLDCATEFQYCPFTFLSLINLSHV